MNVNKTNDDETEVKLLVFTPNFHTEWGKQTKLTNYQFGVLGVPIG